MSDLSAQCPRCTFELVSAATECARCGVVLAKLERSIDQVATEFAPGVADEHLDLPALSPGVDGPGRRALMFGAAIAAAVLLFPFTRFVATYMIILVHELGHAACGWLFGYPSVPAFDFSYGGGVTSIEHRRTTLVVLLFCGWALLFYLVRHSPRAIAIVAAAVGVYAVLAFSNMHEALVTFMGHGSELIFAGIFFYRALSGYAVRVAAERPLYAFLGFFIVARDLAFAWGLMTSEQARSDYADAKGGGHWMDFSQLAHDFGVPLAAVAGLFFTLTLLALPLTWLGFRFRRGIAGVWHRVIAPTTGRT